MTISKVRRMLYRTAARLGDVEAAGKAVRTRSPAPLARRYARKTIYRTEGRVTRRLLRKLGL
jgi:hypothetical protein